MVDNAADSQQHSNMGDYPRGAAPAETPQQPAQQAPIPPQQMQAQPPAQQQQQQPAQVPVQMNMQMPPGAHMAPQGEGGAIPPEQMHYNMMQQQQMYMMQQQYMYPSGSQPGYNQYQNQWNQYQQYQQYQQHLYEQQHQKHHRQQQHFQQPPQPPAQQEGHTPPPTADTTKPPSNPSDQGGTSAPATAPNSAPERKNAWGNVKAKTTAKAKDDVAESMQKLALDDNAEDSQKNGESEVKNSGPKSWADIARDKNIEAAAAAGTGSADSGAEAGDSSGGERSQTQGYRPRGGFRSRGGKHHMQNNRPRLAGRRGLTLQELQGQVQQLVMVQRLVASANQMRVDPSFLYHTQMSQYAVYHYGSYVPMSYTTPGSVALDDNSYPFLQLLSLYPHLVGINQTSIVPNPAHARYFALTCATELEAHAGIKYSRWEFPEKYATLLNQALGEVSGLGPVYCFVIVPTHKRCVGLAEMVSPASPKEPAKSDSGGAAEQNGGVAENEESSDKEEKTTTYSMQLRWICVKDTHLGLYRRASMLADKSQDAVEVTPGEATSAEEQTQENKTQEREKEKERATIYALENSQGLQALQVMLEQPVVSTILLDFKMFDDAEASGSMPSYYRPDFYLPGYSYNSRGRSGYSRGGGRGGRGSYSNRNRGGFHSGNNSYRGGYRRGRGSGRGRGGYRNQEEGGMRYGGHRQQQDSSSSSAHETSHYRERPRRLVTGDGAEVSLDGKYQFEVQRKVKKGKKGKKEAGGEEAKAGEAEVEAEE